MAHSWQTLTDLTRGNRMFVERVRLAESDIALEGRFDLPPLAELTSEDQIFVAAFVRCHGSIKQMEQLFDVSYPTIKNRLNRIGGQLPSVEIELRPESASQLANPPRLAQSLLEQLDRNELSVSEVLARLRANGAEGERPKE
jgi:hypothetical protein